ncbi:hypothetical protein BC829DRAFT_407754, partial [Chytridium lagenaria]
YLIRQPNHIHSSIKTNPIINHNQTLPEILQSTSLFTGEPRQMSGNPYSNHPHNHLITSHLLFLYTHVQRHLHPHHLRMLDPLHTLLLPPPQRRSILGSHGSRHHHSHQFKNHCRYHPLARTPPVPSTHPRFLQPPQTLSSSSYHHQTRFRTNPQRH